jgi:HSP20 family protein
MEVDMTLMRNGNFPAISHLFDDFFTRDLWNWGMGNNSSTNTTVPAVNIRETNDSFIVEMAAPGMKKEDFKVELDGNTLTISSEHREEQEEKEGERYSRREFSYQSFQRSFQLSKDVVDIDGIGAKYENGVLHLVIPKKEEAKQRPPRMIQIS